MTVIPPALSRLSWLVKARTWPRSLEIPETESDVAGTLPAANTRSLIEMYSSVLDQAANVTDLTISFFYNTLPASLSSPSKLSNLYIFGSSVPPRPVPQTSNHHWCKIPSLRHLVIEVERVEHTLAVLNNIGYMENLRHVDTTMSAPITVAEWAAFIEHVERLSAARPGGLVSLRWSIGTITRGLPPLRRTSG